MDLPGFGYARVSQAMKQQWQQTLNRYLQCRRSLRGLVLVMDIRRPMNAFDLELLSWCRDCAMPVQVLLAKSDKLSRGRATATLDKVGSSLQRFAQGQKKAPETRGESPGPNLSWNKKVRSRSYPLREEERARRSSDRP
jgi:GTP-binding protein